MVIFEHQKHDTIGKFNWKLLGRNLKAQLRAEGNITNGLSNRLSNSIEMYFYVGAINYIKTQLGFIETLLQTQCAMSKK